MPLFQRPVGSFRWLPARIICPRAFVGVLRKSDKGRPVCGLHDSRRLVRSRYPAAALSLRRTGVLQFRSGQNLDVEPTAPPERSDRIA